MSINKIKIPKLEDGYVLTIEEFWDDFIEPHLPDKEIVLRWHKILMEYVKNPRAMFAIRGFNNAPKDKYDNLRRGFLTRTDRDYSFFYTDNFHAAYYLKMALDGYVPTVDELVCLYNERRFPARFGRDTSNERELMAMPKGKDPGIQNAGYKIAHVVNVGTDYIYDGDVIPLSKIIEKFYNGGTREDWVRVTDETGCHYARHFEVDSDARKYIVAEFLRFVHPFNYFLAPKKNCAYSSVCKDISEYQPLIDYVQNKFVERYGESYNEFLKLILIPQKTFINEPGSIHIDLKYGVSIKQGSPTKKPAAKKRKSVSVKKESKHVGRTISLTQEQELLIEYLTNPDTSFRKLERQILDIESRARGGGFIAKKIVNGYGFSAKDKGQYTVEQALVLIRSNLNI